MSLIISGSNTAAFPALDPGPKLGRCVQLIDLGKQKTTFQNEEKIVEQVMLVFELPFDRITVDNEEVPRTMSLTYTANLSERANLRKMLESWRGKPFTDEELKGFDLRNIVNKPCTLTISQKNNAEGKLYSYISAVTIAMKGMPVPEAESPVYCFDFDDHDWFSVFENLPDWQKKRIEAGLTYAEKVAEHEQNAFSDVNPEDVPF